MDSKTLGRFARCFSNGEFGAVVLVVDNRMNDDIEVVEEVKQEEIEEVDYPPKLLVDSDFVHRWDGNNATADGFVYDESPQTSTVNVVILDENMATVASYDLPVDVDGYWLVETQISEPGYWILIYQQWLIGPNLVNQSISKGNQAIESEPIFNTDGMHRWRMKQRVQSAVMIHEFPETCEIECRPKDRLILHVEEFSLAI